MTDQEDLAVNRVVAKTLGLDGTVNEQAIADLTDLALGDALYRSLKEVTEHEVDLDNTEHGNSPVSLDVYIDIGIASRAFGYYGDEQEIAIYEMFKMARDLGYRLCIFQHTVEELTEVIGAAASQLQVGSTTMRGPMINYALRTGSSPSDLVTEARLVDVRCREHGIEIVERPPPNEVLTLDEIELEHQIRVGVQQENPRARQRDVDSLTAIFRIRQGQPKESISSSDAIFITHNRSLQAAAHRYFKDHFHNEGKRNIVQLCMTDVVFSSRLWVKLPTTMNWRPRNQIIACALSNLAPAPGVREAFLARLHALVNSGTINEETATYIEFSRFTNEMLALDYNYGDRFDDEETASVVRTVLNKIRSDLEEARKSGAKEAADRAGKEITTLKVQVSELDENSKLQIDVLERQIADLRRDKRIADKVADIISRTVTSLLLIVALLLVTLGAVASFGVEVPKSGLIAAACGAVVLFILGWFGVDHFAILSAIRNKIATSISRRLGRIA